MSHRYSVLKTMSTVTSTGTEPEGTLYTTALAAAVCFVSLAHERVFNASLAMG